MYDNKINFIFFMLCAINGLIDISRHFIKQKIFRNRLFKKNANLRISFPAGFAILKSSTSI